ncbi:cytosine permease, partial [Neisseria canis]
GSHPTTRPFSETPVALALPLLGPVLAAPLPVTRFEPFLLFIGPVSAPMIAVQMADYFVLNRRTAASTDWISLALRLAGFCLYRILIEWHTPLGSTLPVLLATLLLTLVVRKALPGTA